ncbi:MAG: hypothetical protein HYT71_02615 [Candidatus Aenigmarchaeota archaeon]|nr:hypothetical protein [Candidatus Aenigmarchaeota archaeon]
MVDVYIFGERHNDERHSRQQSKFILKKKPDWVLMEHLGEQVKEDPKFLQSMPPDSIEMRKLRMIGKAGETVGAKLAGCDPDMPYRLAGRHSRIVQSADDRKNPHKYMSYTPKLGGSQYTSEAKREERMAKVITAYVKDHNPGKPMVAIVGRYHIRNDSILLKTLEDFGISYQIIDQRIKKPSGRPNDEYVKKKPSL